MNISDRKILTVVIIFFTSMLTFFSCDSGLNQSTTGNKKSTKSKSYSNNEKNQSNYDQKLVRLGKQIPGFGGLFLNKSGQLSIYLTHPANQKSKAAAVLSSFKPLTKTLSHVKVEGQKNRPTSVSEMNIKKASYTFIQLYEWKNKVLQQILGTTGVYTNDINEARNTLDIGVKNDAIKTKIRKKLSLLHIPKDAVRINNISKPALYNKTLWSKFNSSFYIPIGAGIRVAYSNFICTVGLFVRWRPAIGEAFEHGFITASHCTDVQGEVNSTNYYTPLVSNGYYIGKEIRDPAYTPNNCYPVGNKCRQSDAALILNDGSLTEFKIKPKTKSHEQVSLTSGFNGRLDVGSIFRPTNNHGSIDLGSSSPPYQYFIINGVNNFIPQGTYTNKVGERTGWTHGNVSAICKDIVIGNKTLYCQNEVQATADHGDSGAPVFEDIQGSSDPYEATFDGILWGGTTRNGKQYYWYSSVTRVKNELSGPNVHDLQFTWTSH